MYSLKDYQHMFSHEQRGPAFVDVVRSIVRPGDIVLDLGAGAGHLSVVAALAGAGHVYAVETNPLVWLGAELAAANGCSDRITWMQADSRHIDLPERANVMLTDLRAVLPFGDESIAVQNDARARLCTPDVRELTVRDTLWAAPCEAPPPYRHAYRESAPEKLGVNCEPLLKRAAAMWHRAEVGPELLLAAPTHWHTIRYAAGAPTDAFGRPAWKAARRGLLDGLCIWFDSELANGARISNAPGMPDTVYGRAFLPFVEPIPVESGDQIDGEITFKAMPDSYAVIWGVAVAPVAGSSRPLRRARQSTLDQLTFGPRGIDSHALDHRPPVGVVGAEWQTLLSLADGARTNAEIAKELLHRYPRRFTDLGGARDFVTGAVAHLAGAVPTLRRPPAAD